jgi:hypothetical protein
MLAGEAQHFEHYSTVHGAFAAGNDVANFLASFRSSTPAE